MIRYNRHVTNLLGLVLLGVALQVSALPKIQFDGDNSIDFGDYPSKEEKAATFKFHNAGDQDLKIKKSLSACAPCFKVEWSKKEFKPGETGQVKITVLRNMMFGKYTKKIYMETNEPQEKYHFIQLKGNSVPIAEVKPKRLIYAGRLHSNIKWNGTITLTPTQEGVKLGDPVIKANCNSSASITQEKDNSFKLGIKLSQAEQTGDLNCKVSVPVLSPAGWPPIDIQVGGKLGRSFCAVPMQVFLPVGPKGPVSRNFQLRLLGDRIAAGKIKWTAPEGATFAVKRQIASSALMQGTFSKEFLNQLPKKKRVTIEFEYEGADTAKLVIIPQPQKNQGE